MLAEIEAKLTTDAAAIGLNLVESAATFSAIKDNPPLSKQPAAYVVPVADMPGPNPFATSVHQQILERFAVVLALGNFKDKTGATATQQMEAVKKNVIMALLGWSPVDGAEGCLYARGVVVGLKNGVVWQQLEFTTKHSIRKV